jgi:putative oxidoreductase
VVTTGVSLGLLVLRLAIGLVFVVHGANKLFVTGVPSVMGFLAELGITPPALWAWSVTLGELAGGAALIVGVLTRVAACVTAASMMVAIATVLWVRGFFVPGYEFALTLLAASVALQLAGPGRYAVDTWLGLET